MGVDKLPDNMAALDAAGLDPETPVAMIERATYDDETVVICSARRRARPRARHVRNDSRRRRPESYVHAKLDAGERLIGFGHRVYDVRDPRAAVLSSAAERFYRRYEASASGSFGNRRFP